MGGFYLGVELHREGSAPADCAAVLFLAACMINTSYEVLPGRRSIFDIELFVLTLYWADLPGHDYCCYIFRCASISRSYDRQ